MTLLFLSLICTTVPSRAERLMIKGLWLGALYFPGLESPWRVSSGTDPIAMLPEVFFVSVGLNLYLLLLLRSNSLKDTELSHYSCMVS